MFSFQKTIVTLQQTPSGPQSLRQANFFNFWMIQYMILYI